jgi:2-phosphoglycerate kinase
VGKSTVSQSLAFRLGWDRQSTDKLARHPGRPWQAKPKEVPNHVADHYRTLSAEELIADVLHHYRENVWPLIKNIVTLRSTDASTDKLILEGSAILPELVITLDFESIAVIWLTASNEFLKQRIYAESQYETKSLCERMLVDKFVARNHFYNNRMMDAVNQFRLVYVDVTTASNVLELMEMCVSASIEKIP